MVSFVVTIVASVIIGLVAGFVAERLMRLADDHLIEVAISVVAYGVPDRRPAPRVRIIATPGWLRPGQRGWVNRLSVRTVDSLDIVWGVHRVPADGADIPAGGPGDEPGAADGLAARDRGRVTSRSRSHALVVYGSSAAVRGSVRREGAAAGRVPARDVLGGAGGRGRGRPRAGAAARLPDRDLLTGAVFGVVLITLLVQGTTAGWVIRRAGVIDAEP